MARVDQVGCRTGSFLDQPRNNDARWLAELAGFASCITGGSVGQRGVRLTVVMKIRNYSQFDSRSSSPFQLPVPTLPGSQHNRGLGGIGNDSVGDTLDSRSSSVWTAPSPSNVDRTRSPTLPTLPNRVNPDRRRPSQESPIQHQRSESSYYTALWGSPYDLPSQSRVISGGQTRSRSSTLTPDNSPLRTFKSGRRQRQYSSPQLERRGTFPVQNLDQALFTSTEDSAGGKPGAGRTQDWLRAQFNRRKTSENLNWLSDDSDTDRKTSNHQHNSNDHGNNWLGITTKTPRQLSLSRTFLDNARNRYSTKHRKAFPSDATVTQQDFDDIFRPSGEGNPQASKMLAAMVQGAVPRRESKAEKPLPPYPHNRTASEAPDLMDINPLTKRPTLGSIASFQRPRKKIVWKGKTCTIALPLEGGRDQYGNPKKVLSSDEVSALMAEWERKGYSTKGFDLYEPYSPVHGQSRDVFPDPSDFAQEWQNKNFRVKIPSRESWDQYVRDLQEEKLRALGVSFGEEEPSRNSPALPNPMSRQPSFQSIAPSLPALPMSANSFRSQLDHGLSPPPMASANQFAQSMISPSGQPIRLQSSTGVHFPKQSMALPPGHVISPGSQYPPQPTPPLSGPWPPQHMLGSLPGSRGASPFVDGRRQSVRVTHSPISPLPDSVVEGYLNGTTQLPMHLRHASTLHPALIQSLQAQLQSQQANNAARLASELLTPDAQPRKYVSQPEIASPLPQGHRHNLSANLQREIDEAEKALSEADYHLEDSIRRQLEEDDAPKDKNESTVSMGPIEEPREEKPPHKHTQSDIETNPSLVGSPKPQESDMDTKSTKSLPKHTPKASTSKLNVKAQEFVFDPTKSFTRVFSFGSDAVVPPGPKSAPTQGLHSKNASGASTFSSNLNVAAQPFTPGKFQVPSSSHREFSFSSAMPLKPDAPTFTPGGAFGLRSDGNVSSEAPKIFGTINFTETINPMKKSRAIPIVKPKSLSESDLSDDAGYRRGIMSPEPGWDEFGRPTQDRQKRQRRGGDSGDQIPLFATPTPEPEAIPAARESPVHRRTPSIDAPEEESSSPVVMATGQLKDIIDEVSAGASSSEDVPTSANEDSLLAKDKPAPTASEVSRSSAPSPTPPKLVELEAEESEADAPHELDEKPDYVVAPLSMENDGPVSPPLKSSLSAAAKPFVFNPGASGFAPETSVKEPEEEKVEETTAPPPVPPKAPFRFGLGASRYASAEPSPAFANSPAITSPELPLTPEVWKEQRPAKSANTQLIDGVSYVEPTTYQEIDDVMKHLNGEDSDFGVERNPVEAWRSPARSIASNRVRTPANAYSIGERTPELPNRLGTTPQSITASPNRLQQPFQYLPADHEYGSSESSVAELVQQNARFSPSFKPRDSNIIESSVHRLNSTVNAPISDWDDAISSGDEAKFRTRTGFFDSKVNHLISDVVDQRLQPLEKNLATISQNLALMASRSTSRRYRRSNSADVENSDADDEDDETLPARTLSPLKDRKLDRLKASIVETLNAQRPVVDIAKISEDLAELKASIHEQNEHQRALPLPVTNNEDYSKIIAAIATLEASVHKQPETQHQLVPQQSEEYQKVLATLTELKASVDEQKQQRPDSASGNGSNSDIKKLIEETISRQMRGKSGQVTSSSEASSIEKLKLQVAGLESMLKVAEDRANDELKAHRTTQDELAETERELRFAKADAAENRDAAEETEQSLRSFLDDQQQFKQQMAAVEEVRAVLEKSVSDLSEKNFALEETIEEYRISHTTQKDDLEDSRAKNNILDRTIHALKSELEEGINAKQDLKQKFERLQANMTDAAQNIAKDQSSWRRRQEELKAKHDHLAARLEAEARTRERLEQEIDRLEKQEKEAMKARFLVEQIRGENQHLVKMVNELRSKHHESQERAMAFERQLHDTKENNRLDIGRIMNSTKGDVAAANQQVELLRASLEGVIGQLEADLEHAHTEFKEAKKRHELMLEEASSSRDTALREAAEAREAALQEHYRFHERTLEDTKAAHEQTLAGIKANHDRTLKNAIDDHSRALANAIDDHERALGNSVEDKKMTENYLNGRLTLADEKVMHYQDRLQHLEDKLEITKSAAQAVAEAARTARETTLPVPASRGSMPMASGSNLPEKISPQALRESIIVLQEQLHERESQIEKLEQEFEMVDKDAPSKLKARDEEITWLRELLGVRLDDLQDIITTLSTPSYDRNEVRDAAIRLRANVQMEQQERERIMAGGGKFPSLASITNNITASPRNLPLAAAAAWGNWRKGQGSIGSLAEMAAPIRGDRSASQTPSKSSPQSFLSGLLTPPSTNMRQTPKTGPSTSTRQPQHRPLGGYSTPKRQISSAQEHHRRPLTDILPPETPALFRSASYDQDAEAGHYSLDPYVNNGEDVNEGSSLDGSFNTESQDERENPRALGPSIELAG